MKPGIRKSIAYRLLLVVLGLYSLVALVVTATHVVLEYHYQENLLETDLEDIRAAFEGAVADSVWKMDQEALNESVAGILKIPVIVGLKVSDTGGRLVAAGGWVPKASGVRPVDPRVNLLGLDTGDAPMDGPGYGFTLLENSFPILKKENGDGFLLGHMSIFSSSAVIYRHMKLQLLLLAVNVILTFVTFGIALFWAVRHYLGNPLGELARAAEALRLENLDASLVSTRAPEGSELRQLEEAFNHMVQNLDQALEERRQAEADLQKSKERLLQSQRMESIGRLAGGVAHDFNNMLSIILGNTEILLEDINASVFPSTANILEIRKAAERSADLTRQLLAFARKQPVSPRVIDLNETLAGMLNMLRRLIGEDIELAWQFEEQLWSVKIDPSQVDQVLANLCVNARDAVGANGRITIETGNTRFDEAYCRVHDNFKPGNYVMLSVSDNGCGMDRETMDNLFEPFFTTKEVGRGTGLGLATVYGIVRQNSGFVHVYSEKDQGTVFKIYFLKHGESLSADQTSPLESAPRVGRETVLVVEDETAILTMTQLMLERMGYRVLAADTPTKALGIMEQEREIHLLITDVVMPEMNGRELSRRLLQSHPNLKCLFMSGYTADVIANHGILDEDLFFINKPFSKQALSQKLREILDGETDPA